MILDRLPDGSQILPWAGAVQADAGRVVGERRSSWNGFAKIVRKGQPYLNCLLPKERPRRRDVD